MVFRDFYLMLAVVTALAFGQPTFAQPKTFYHKDTLKSAAVSVKVRFSHMKTPMVLSGSEYDTLDLGSDGAPGKTVTAYIDSDSIQIRNDNFPFEERHHFPLLLAGRKYSLRLRFNNVRAYFSPEYIRESSGRTFVEIPETFELANILLMLSPAGQKAGNMVGTGQYHDEVAAYFKPYLGHPVFKVLDVPEARYMTNYYEFRENSICYQFSGDRLTPSRYFLVYGSDDSTYANAFRNNVELVADFARISGFRDFYQKHLPYYRQLIAQQTAWSDLAGMQKWLEKEFIKPKIDCSRLIFSPIIYSTHSTQRFGGFGDNSRLFQERLLFVGGPDDGHPEWNDQQRRGSLAGVIFTEMDHNYVNPRTEDFETPIDSLFSNRAFWSPGREAEFYPKPQFVFNEYMTHALFSLYVIDTFDKPTADFLIARREAMMVERRGFIKFREFNAALMRLKKENAGTTVSALYPKIIDWCRSFAKR